MKGSAKILRGGLINEVICARVGETLESVSSCTRFSGILKISNFGFNCSSSKLVGMFFGIVPMFVQKDFVQDCFVGSRRFAPKCACAP